MVAELQESDIESERRAHPRNWIAEQAWLEARRDAKLAWIPNVPHASVPAGSSSLDNVTARTWGDLQSFRFQSEAAL